MDHGPGLIGPTQQDRLTYRMLSDTQDAAARERMRLQDDLERALSGGPVPLPEVECLNVDIYRDAMIAHERVRFAFEAVKGAELVLADVASNPAPDETPRRWTAAHLELVRLRSELHKAQGEALEIRAEVERAARRMP